MRKLDFFRECNTHGVSEDDFRQAFCVRCVQPECARSSVNQTKFEERVTTWEERLFTNVPRMDPNDPLYQKIAGQKFIEISPSDGVGPVTPTSEWVDPLQNNLPTPPIVVQVPSQISQTKGLNAPDQSGKVIGPSQTQDKPPERVVRPGARIRFTKTV